jgi:hypothetical protein
MKNKNSFAIGAVFTLSSLTFGMLTGAAVAAPNSTTALTPVRLATYTPFPNARAMPLRACAKPVVTGKDMKARASIKCSKATIGWRFNNYRVGIELRSAGRSRSISFNDGGMYSGFREPQAFEGDLNGDGRSDYLIQHDESPNWDTVTDAGTMVLALSGPSGYRLVESGTTLLTSKSIVRRAGRVYLLSAQMLLATGTDRRTHSYFRFVPLEVRGQRLIANRAVWIQYTKVANHKPAKNLSTAEKLATLKEYGIRP